MFKCDYTDIEYKGQCPIKNCIANVGNKHKSGCFHHMFKNTSEVELSRVFDIEGLDSEIDSLFCLAALYHWHDKCVVEPFCISCGMFNTNLCNNIDNCDKRKFFAESLLNKYPCNLLSIERQHIWALCNIRERIRAKNLKFKDMLGLNILDYRKLIELSSI